MIFALNEPCLAGDGVVAFMFQINRALSLIGLYFLLLPFSIISCLPGVSLHVFFKLCRILRRHIFYLFTHVAGTCVLIIITTEGGILESASVRNFSILTKVFIYLDMFLREDDDEFVSVSENFQALYLSNFPMKF